MSPEEIKDAVWVARLLTEGKVIMLTGDSAMAIAKALVAHDESLRVANEIFVLEGRGHLQVKR